MKINKIIETALYCDDVASLAFFYQDILNFSLIREVSDRGAFLRAGDSVLIIFNRELTLPEGQRVPSHGANGVQHIAFEVDNGGLEEWKNHLIKKGISIEKEIFWEEKSAQSLYFRDTAGHSIEITEKKLWN